MANVKKVKRKIRLKGVLFLLFLLEIIGSFFYTVFTMPIKNININNTQLLSDNEIIMLAGIKDYPKLIKVNTKRIESKLQSLELVNNVKVKKTILGKLIIDIVENKPLFYNRKTNLVVLSNNAEVQSCDLYLGIPALVNEVPKDLLKSFVTSFKNVNEDVIKMINEIEYDPDISGEVVIDNERFLLRMNDTNLVYINIINMEKLNDYKNIYAAIGEQKGTILLDSYSSDNGVVGLFTPFENNSGDMVKEDGES